MSDFERDVIDRLARIETNAALSSNLATVVTLQGARVDAIEKRLNTMRDRMWSFIIFGPLLVPIVVEYVRIHVLGISFLPGH